MMNNRQAGAFRELIEKEERTRQKWVDTWKNLQHGQTQPQQQQDFQQSQTGGNLNLSQSQFPVPGSYDPNAPVISHNHIYEQAIRISSPRLVDDGQDPLAAQPPVVSRKVLRQVEVPYVRQVKVPVKTRKIVPVVVQKKVRTKKLVELPSWKEVDEEYTEVVEQPAVRQKEIWVKKVVPERYMKQVEVKRNRKVKVPSTVLKEVDDFEIVNVTENKALEVDGFRVDEVQDSKVVEVEEYQQFELHPHATGRAEVVNARDLGAIVGKHHARRVGTEVYHTQDERIRDVENDDLSHDGGVRSVSAGFYQNPLRASGQNIARANSASSTLANSQSYRHSQGFPSLTGDNSASSADLGNIPRLGFKVKNAAANGCIVYRVQPGDSAERAGLQVGDTVMYCNNRPTRNLAEFRSVLASCNGPLMLQVSRRGFQKLLLTVHR